MKKNCEKGKTSKEEDSSKCLPKDEQIKFDLADDLRSYVNLEVKNESLSQIGNFLQKLHLKNHAVSSRETIHEVYRPDEEITENESYLFSREDELLFNEIQQAIAERDVIALRGNLQFISQNTSAHNYSFDELEDYVEGILDETFTSSIRQELAVNTNLAEDVKLLVEINEAIGEKDIIQLRADLALICENESSHSRSVEEIESYLSNELDNASREAFEEEMYSNNGLMKDVKIHKEVDEAIGEKDIINLRKDLIRVKDSEIKDDHQKRGITAPKIQKTVWIAAASIILLIGLNVTFSEHSFSNAQLYNQFYQPFESHIGINRSASFTGENLVNMAILKMNQKDYDSALNLFSDELKNDQNNVVCNFYTGAIQQKKGNYNVAIDAYENVIKQGDNLFIEQSQWNIGLCFLNRNEREKAIEQFRKIIQKQGYYQKKAEEILKKLE